MNNEYNKKYKQLFMFLFFIPVVVTGPDNTPYEGGVFHLNIEIPEK